MGECESDDFVPKQAYEMRRLRDYQISHVFRSPPNGLLHNFVTLKNAFLTGWHDPLYRNPPVDLWQNRPRFDTADLVCKHRRFLYLVSASCAPVASCAYLDIRALEANFPTRVFDKSVINIVLEYFWIPSAKERRFAHQGVCFFPGA